MKCWYPLRALLLCLAPLAVAHAATAPHYRIVQQVSLPGEEGWDYLTFEQGRHRLFIAHGSRVLVVDTDKLAVAGEIDNTPGVHGIALAADLGRGYISAGRANVIVVFDLKTLARLKEIRTTGEGPDAILYDPATHRVFSFNGHGRNVTAVDTATDTVVGTIPLDAKPESAAADGRGRVYVNLEDTRQSRGHRPAQARRDGSLPDRRLRGALGAGAGCGARASLPGVRQPGHGGG